MKPYTVILLRGRRFARLDHAERFGTDAYVAHVEATEPTTALAPALAQVLKADRLGYRRPCSEAGITLTEKDYIELVVLEGHCNPVLWHWQL